MFLMTTSSGQGQQARNTGWVWKLAVLVVLGGVAVMPSVVQAAVPPKPALQLPLRELGFPGYATSMLHQGASMITVHLLDNTHLLLTYGLRSLVPRLPGDHVNDSDREVAAVLVQLPDGKVLARTKWRLHDHGRYLWSVGHGRFVMRSGQNLALLAPLQALAAGGDPLMRYALPRRAGEPVLVEGSPDGKLITMEFAEDLPAAGDAEGDPQKPERHYVLEFLRLQEGAEATKPTGVSVAGVIGSPVLLHLAMDGDGYLWADDGQRGRWTVSFNEFGGKQQKLTPIMSSCHPRLNLLSRNEFLVETCRGSDDAPMLASYGFDGHENWQETVGSNLQPPTLAIAPNVGRFAISRLSAFGGGSGVSGMGPDETTLQEIRVYQTESGDMLLRLQCAPVVRSAENFDLAPDGSMLAVLAAETLDLYRLPALSARDRKDLEDAANMTPPEGSGPVLLSRITRPVADSPHAEGSVASGSRTALPMRSTPVREAQDPGAATALPSPAAAPSKVTAAAVERGAETVGAAGADQAAPRKPPTLLNPGEAAEYQGQSSGPK